MRTLQQGVHHFQTQVMPTMREHFAGLADGQQPQTLFVTCSDSRVDPSLITQTSPGELFVLRNAGNLVPLPGADDGSASAVEYAVSALKVRRIVVCGHSGCGAMGGLLNPQAVAGVPVVARWIEHAKPTLFAVGQLDKSEQLPQAIRHNASAQLENLMAHRFVRDAVEAGNLTLEAWVYDIRTGHVDVLPAQTESS